MKKWNFQNDFIHLNEKPLFRLTNEELYKFGSSAWVLNTAKGLYYNKFCSLDDKCESENNIYLCDGKSNKLVLKNAIILGTLCNKYFIVIYSAEKKFDYLIDTRGEIFRLGQNKEKTYYSPGAYKIKKDVKMGNFVVGNKYKISYIKRTILDEYFEKMKPLKNLKINKKYKEFLSKNKNNDLKYFYLTLNNSKAGSISKLITENIKEYEIIPNIFEDDETLNIRIEINDKLISNKATDYLESKYLTLRNYCMYNIHIGKYVQALDIPNDKKNNYQFWFCIPNESEMTMLIQINNTLKNILKIDDDNKLYAKVFKPFLKLIGNGNIDELKRENNYFEQFRFSWPTHDNNLNKRSLLNRINLLNQIMDEKYTVERIENLDATEIECLLQIGYRSTKKIFKNEIMKYESSLIDKMISSGVYIPKWKSEAQLFSLVHKYYKDAIFQYRTSWLLNQSLDIYIPSLNIGIEYQGQQHYTPIDYFGGEETFIEYQKRDKVKYKLCQDNGVKLLYWKYDEVISKNNLNKKISLILIE